MANDFKSLVIFKSFVKYMSTMKEHIIILIFLQKGIDNQLYLYDAPHSSVRLRVSQIALSIVAIEGRMILRLSKSSGAS